MYNINFDKYIEFVDWQVVYWGIQNDFLEPKCAISYAHKMAEYNITEDESLIVDLLILDTQDKNSVVALIEESVAMGNIDAQRCKRVLRYIILDMINQSAEDVLSRVENVYADFEYPEDMNSFISYMPVEDGKYNPSEHNEAENKQRLIGKFNEFLKNELMHFKRCN